eukprot:scaffold39537_cov51-Phaeocystis_antarctica.AAC.2
MPSFRLSAVRVGVQPAAELRHLERHDHDQHVLRALLPVPCPESAVEPSSAHCVHRGHPLPSRLSGHTSYRSVCPPFDSRQNTKVFDQPLSFDTSSVTNMYDMFGVRSSPCLALNLQSSPRLHAACAAVARRLPRACQRIYLAPHRMPPFRLSAARVCVQPAAELRHLWRHDYAVHVQRALLRSPCPAPNLQPSPFSCTPLASPCPAPNLQSSPPLHAACTAVARRLPPHGTLHLTPHRVPPFRLSAVRDGVQPAAEL